MNWHLPNFGAKALEEELFAALDDENKNNKTTTGRAAFHSESSSEEEEMSGSSEEDGGKGLNRSCSQQPWSHLCILDFEACREKVADVQGEEWLYEITELPVTLLNSSTLQVEDSFHRYCRPARIAPDVLHRYINGKYGAIGQAETFEREAVSLLRALQDLEQWLVEKDLLLTNVATGEDSQPKFAFITCGDWDFKNALPRNCHLLGLQVPHFMREWINIKTVYQKFYKTRRPPAGMTVMLRALDIPLEGTHHFGKDDANNIAKIAHRMISDGCQFFITGREADMWHSASAGGGTDAQPPE